LNTTFFSSNKNIKKLFSNKNFFLLKQNIFRTTVPTFEQKFVSFLTNNNLERTRFITKTV
jgi:hypothetical protein